MFTLVPPISCVHPPPKCTPMQPDTMSTMPDHVVRELMNMNVAKLSGTLEDYKEECLRKEPELFEAVFSKHNQFLAAKLILCKEFSCYPVFSKNKEVQMDRMIEAAVILAKEKPHTIHERRSALASLRKKPKSG